LFKKTLKKRTYKIIVEEVRKHLEEKRKRAKMVNLLLSFSPTICALCWTTSLICTIVSFPGKDDLTLILFPVTIAFAVLSFFAIYHALSKTSKVSLNLLLRYGSLLQRVPLSKKDDQSVVDVFERLKKSYDAGNIALAITALFMLMYPVTLYTGAFIFPLIINRRLKINRELEEKCFAIIRKDVNAFRDPVIANFMKLRKPIVCFSNRKIVATTLFSFSMLSGYWQFKTTRILEDLT